MSSISKEEKLKKIRQNRFLTRMFIFLGASNLASALPNSTSIGENKENRIENVFASNRMAFISKIDIHQEIEKRTDWFLSKYLNTLKEQLDVVKSMENNPRAKYNYIKKNYFDKVFEKGGIRGDDKYCIAAIAANLNQLNQEYGDAEDLISNCKTLDGHNNVSCERFIKYVGKKFPQDLIKTRKITDALDTMKVGSIVFVETQIDTSSGLHAMTYIGKDANGICQFISFNRDRICTMEEYNNRGYVVNLPNIISSSWREKSRDKNKIEFMNMIYSGRIAILEETTAQQTPVKGKINFSLTTAQLKLKSGNSL